MEISTVQEAQSTLITLTPGEIRALKRGLDVTSECQLAVCYLAAHHSVLETRVSFGVNINHDNLSVEIGMNPETYRRTFNKFRLIINDQHQDEEFTNAEAIYPKIVKAHAIFVDMPYNEVMGIALQAFTPEAKELGQRLKDEFLERNRKGSAKRVKVKKENEKTIANKVTQLYNGFKTKYDFKTSEKKAFAIIATEEKLQITEVKKIWESHRKIE